jgi:hypothetical protein
MAGAPRQCSVGALYALAITATCLLGLAGCTTVCHGCGAPVTPTGPPLPQATVSGLLLSTHFSGLIRGVTAPVTGSVIVDGTVLRATVNSANVGYSIALPIGETNTLTAHIAGGRCAPITLTITKATPIRADFQCSTGLGSD